MYAAALSPDGGTVAAFCTSAGKQGLFFLEASTLRAPATRGLTSEDFGDRGKLENVTYFPSGRVLAASASDGVHIIEANTQKLLCSLRGRGGTDHIAISSDGALIATNPGTYRVCVWRWQDELRILEPSRTIKSHPRGERNPRIRFSPDGMTLAVTCAKIDFARKSSGSKGGGSIAAAPVQAARDEVADGTFIKSSPSSGSQQADDIKILLLDGTTGKLKGYLSTSQIAKLNLKSADIRIVDDIEYFSTIKFSPDNSLLAAGTDTGRASLFVWSVAEAQLNGFSDVPQRCVDFHVNRTSTAITVLTDRGELFHNKDVSQNGQTWEKGQVDGEFGRRSIAATPSKEYLLSGLSIRDAKDHSLVFEATIDDHEYYSDLNCTSDSRFVYALHESKVVRWDLEQGTFSFPFVFHSGNNNIWARDIALSPTGNVLASSSGDGGIRLWDTASGELLAKLAGQSGEAAIDYAPDGTTIVAACEDGTTRFWDVSQFLPEEGVLLTSPAVAALPTFREFTVANGAKVKVVFDRAVSGEEVQAALSEALEKSRNTGE